MELDPLLLSRVQFAFTVTFHIIFPSFTIGLAAWLATIEGLSILTGRAVYRRLFDFWLKIFGVSFGMGVVSGIVMAFQFGTNWSVLAAKGGAIQGPLLGYEAFTAFILEATFLGVVFFARARIPPWAYLGACCMVALGTTFSAFWIMVNNSWMQVPLGYQEVGGRFVPVDWLLIVLSDVGMIRLAHMLLGAYLTTAFCVAATGAWYALRHIHEAESRVMLRMALGLAAILVPAQIYVGDLNGKYTRQHQLSKFTAIEGRWQTEQPARLLLFALPDVDEERNSLELALPYLGSYLADGSFTSQQPGIVTVPRDERPPIWIPFFAFRVMVGMGLVMLALAWAGVFLWWRGRLDRARPFLWATFLAFPTGFTAVVTGWYVAEIGRQPWAIYGVMRTADALTPSLTGGQVLATLVAYVLVYALIFAAGIFYIYRLLEAGPAPGDEPPIAAGVTAKRPLGVPGER